MRQTSQPVCLVPLQDDEEAVGRLIEYMQAMQGQALWPYEQSTLQRPHLGSAAALQHLVQSVVRVDVLICHSSKSSSNCDPLLTTFARASSQSRKEAAHLTECMQVELLRFEADIRGQWAAEAMRWMLQSSSRQLTTRSHQVVCYYLP